MLSPPPPLTALADLDAQLAAAGWAVLDAPVLEAMAGVPAKACEAWRPYWANLPADTYLRDGGHYRRRRHGSFVVEASRCRSVPPRAHWQPLSYNALHGGIERWFEPLPENLVTDVAWQRLMVVLAASAARLRGGNADTAGNDRTCGTAEPWFGEAHLFRIDTTGGIGRPTPEGAHRDGVDLVAVLLASRLNIRGGETRVFDARSPQGVRFTLAQPWSALLLDDERVIHETTPIQPLDPDAPAHRDTLVITLRRGGFQDPAPMSQRRAAPELTQPPRGAAAGLCRRLGAQ